ncbi:Uncharacterized protein HZ326_25022 [Fusarium oxysporum f. sp. albedinis]|nr:Uncharacterized protein HZ326_25022 [Fusarium oxysporum f. sp. albedinis]
MLLEGGILSRSSQCQIQRGISQGRSGTFDEVLDVQGCGCIFLRLDEVSSFHARSLHKEWPLDVCNIDVRVIVAW